MLEGPDDLGGVVGGAQTGEAAGEIDHAFAKLGPEAVLLRLTVAPLVLPRLGEDGGVHVFEVERPDPSRVRPLGRP